MALKLNDAPLFNVLLLLNNTPLHAILSFNMNQFKFVLSVNSNALVLLLLTQLSMFNNMVLHSSKLVPSFHKLVLLVLLKILYVYHPL
jgi:hypothetical protein